MSGWVSGWVSEWVSEQVGLPTPSVVKVCSPLRALNP